ncbi:aldo/keto reductase [Streptomyces sp. SPB162]|uniref:aldo/keto reductase n=1 Tax=Streptomyces sp. SPB162 TaxID=2940560 RepID=UPI002A53A61B|nr:aryl-alcohol dehydrogenase-like predicted oxidoreductase [Streptomyces sp. SPB162]
MARAPATPFAAFHEVARDRGVSAQRIMLAWLPAKSPVVVPTPGAGRPGTVRDSAAAGDIILNAAEFAHLDGAGSAPSLT